MRYSNIYLKSLIQGLEDVKETQDGPNYDELCDIIIELSNYIIESRAPEVDLEKEFQMTDEFLDNLSDKNLD